MRYSRNQALDNLLSDFLSELNLTLDVEKFYVIVKNAHQFELFYSQLNLQFIILPHLFEWKLKSVY